MEYKVKLLSTVEKAVFDLRELYRSYGYSQFSVGKFEEYDFYAQNKSFITGDSILTFTDMDGTLMALKPDITLSIIKSTKASPALRKVYYNENVYRAQNASSGFREITQTGLECVGPLDVYSVCEVIMLSAMSLEKVNSDYLLDISHIGLVPGFLEYAGADRESAKKLIEFAGEKNLHDAAILCRSIGMGEGHIKTLGKLMHMRTRLCDALDELQGLDIGEKALAAANELSEISENLSAIELGDKIFLDLSLGGDMRYYNGVIFRGFISGIPTAVLSGGRYDTLLRKMKKDGGAIGFAFYLDMLTGHFEEPEKYDFDILLIKNGNDPPAEILKAVKKLSDQGKRVRVDVSEPEGLKYEKSLTMGEIDG